MRSISDLPIPRSANFALATLVASAVSVAGACGSATPTAPSASTTTPPPVGAPGLVAGCEVTRSTPGTPLTDPKSPFFDNLGLASSADGRVASQFREVLAHGSAPDGVRLPDGGIGVYYVNGETDGVWLARASAGSLVPVSPITVDGVIRPVGTADPDAVLVNGRVRLFYLNGFASGGGRNFCVAESSDGVSFQTRALAIRFTGTEADPSVVQLPDGSWLMAFSRANHTEMGLARSGDGLTFAQYDTQRYGVVPELAVTEDGRVRLYVCTDGVDSYASSDRGTTWAREGRVIGPAATGRAIVCDPSYVPSVGLFILKTTDAR